jgi:hypothetical protein
MNLPPGASGLRYATRFCPSVELDGSMCKGARASRAYESDAPSSFYAPQMKEVASRQHPSRKVRTKRNHGPALLLSS